jgi:MFS family permease
MGSFSMETKNAGPADPGAGGPWRSGPQPGRSLLSACVVHVLHDGYTDLLYALLPVWQAQFGLSYTGLAAVRTLYYGTMGGLQVPGDRLAERFSLRMALTVSTFVAALGYLVMALPFGFAGLCVGLVLTGIGSSVQHPRASLLVTKAYGTQARGPLGIYNFAGDLGKATLPALVALLLPVFAWRPVLGLVALLGFVVGISLLKLVPRRPLAHVATPEHAVDAGERSGLGLLMVIGALDTATRMGYLLFLPFLIQDRGGTSVTLGLGLALVFAGGAIGKAVCGWLGHHLGVVGSVVITEVATAALIATTLFVPLSPMLALLPFLGVVLNGTSSVLYGTVPELAPKGDTAHAFALFYTSVIGAGAFAPLAYGAIADHLGQSFGVISSGVTALLTLPLIVILRPALVIRSVSQ